VHRRPVPIYRDAPAPADVASHADGAAGQRSVISEGGGNSRTRIFQPSSGAFICLPPAKIGTRSQFLVLALMDTAPGSCIDPRGRSSLRPVWVT